MKETNKKELEQLQEELLIRVIRGLEEAQGDLENAYYQSLSQDIDFKNSQNQNALHIACKENKIKAVKFFLDQGVDVIEIDSDNKLAIELTTNEEIKKIIKESESWRYFEDEAQSYLKIKSDRPIDLSEEIFSSFKWQTSDWQKQINKIEKFIDFQNQENLENQKNFSEENSRSISGISDLTQTTFKKNFGDKEDASSTQTIQEEKSKQQYLDISQIDFDLIEPEIEQKRNQQNQEQRNSQSVSFLEVWRKLQEDLTQEKLAKEEELKLRNRETNLMFAEDNLAKEIRKFEEKKLAKKQRKEQQKKLKKNPQISQQNLDKKLNEDEEILNSVIEENQKFQQKIDQERRQEFEKLESFISEIYLELGFEKKGSSDFEEYQEDESIKLLGILLTAAVVKKNYQTAEKLLNHSLSNKFIDYKDAKVGKSSLILACANSSFDIAKLLIEKGADVKILDKNNNSALNFCAMKKDETTQEKKAYLQQSNINQDVQSSEIAQMIINQTADDWSFLSARNDKNACAFTSSCAPNGNDKILSILMKTKAFQENQSEKMPLAFLTAAVVCWGRNDAAIDQTKINQRALKLIDIYQKNPQFFKRNNNEPNQKPATEIIVTSATNSKEANSEKSSNSTLKITRFNKTINGL